MIRAPVRGMVQDIRVHTKTGVVRPAEPIMEIVPLNDELIVNARVRPARYRPSDGRRHCRGAVPGLCKQARRR